MRFSPTRDYCYHTSSVFLIRASARPTQKNLKVISSTSSRNGFSHRPPCYCVECVGIEPYMSQHFMCTRNCCFEPVYSLHPYRQCLKSLLTPALGYFPSAGNIDLKSVLNIIIFILYQVDFVLIAFKYNIGKVLYISCP